MTLNNYVQVACLPDSSKLVYPNMNGIQGYITGWGETKQGEFPKLYNQVIELKILYLVI